MEPKPGVQARQFYTTQEVAQLTGCHRNHITNCINRGELPAVRLGRSYRIPISEFEAWKRRGITPKSGWDRR